MEHIEGAWPDEQFFRHIAKAVEDFAPWDTWERRYLLGLIDRYARDVDSESYWETPEDSDLPAPGLVESIYPFGDVDATGEDSLPIKAWMIALAHDAARMGPSLLDQENLPTVLALELKCAKEEPDKCPFERRLIEEALESVKMWMAKEKPKEEQEQAPEAGTVLGSADLRPSQRNVLALYEYAERKIMERGRSSVTDKEAYEFLKEHGCGDVTLDSQLGTSSSFRTRLSRARTAAGQNKKPSKTGRSNNRGIARSSQLDHQDLQKMSHRYSRPD
ncbi:MAG: hypothetical protein ACLFVU_14065 [Phycisphaerae bacterium]